MVFIDAILLPNFARQIVSATGKASEFRYFLSQPENAAHESDEGDVEI
jgi:hypothetical protein